MKDKTNDGKSFYNLWFILEGKGVNRGSVIDALCRSGKLQALRPR